MADRFKYSEVRQNIIDAIRTDLIGPREKEEVLEENPRFQNNAFLFFVLLDNLDFTDNNQIIFWKTIDEKKSQFFPCLFFIFESAPLRSKCFTFLYPPDKTAKCKGVNLSLLSAFTSKLFVVNKINLTIFSLLK